jgi:putative endonuclease
LLEGGPSPNVGSAKARAGSMNTPGPFNFHKSRTSLCGRVSKTQPAWGSTRATCQFFFGVVADKQCTCPENLQNRLNDHNAGKVPHTSKFRPWVIRSATAFKDKGRAIAFERYLKSGSGRAFLHRHL